MVRPTSPPSNIAGELGYENLDNLVPHLQARLPAVFSLNGIAARAIAAPELPRPALRPDERLLLLEPFLASHSEHRGQSLFIMATLLDKARDRKSVV